MRKSYHILLTLLSCLLLLSHVQASNNVFNNHVDEAVSGLNKLIEHNDRQYKSGNTSELNFIYDFRHPALVAQADKLPESLVNDVNLQLRSLNEKTGIRFYVMMSDLYEVLSQHEYRTPGYTHYVIEGKVYTVEDVDSWLGTDAALALKRKNEEIAKEFTRLVAERSRISDETKRGVLLNIEALFLPGFEQKWTYQPIVALGRYLSAGTVLQVKEYLTRNLNRSYDFDSQFEASMLHYVTVIGNNLLTFEGDFDAEEVGETIEAQLLSYNDADGKIWAALGHEYSVPIQQNNSNYIIKDYAHILEADPRFSQTISSNLYDANTTNTLTGLTGGEHVKFLIYTTSDKNLDPSGRSAIQLAAEEGLRQYENENVIVMGLHYRNEDSGNKVQVITRFTKRLEDIINDKRAEDGYAWYRNTNNNHVVYGSRLVTYRYTAPFASNDHWELLGKYKAIGLNDKVFFNSHSDIYLWALFVNKVDETNAELNAFMYEHSEQIANGVINVAFIAATGGSSLVIQGARSALVYGSKIAMGFTLDVILQASLYKYFNGGNKKPDDITWEEAFENIDYWQASRTGAESLYESAIAAGVLGCIGDVITLTPSGDDLKVETSIDMETLSMACIKGFVFNVLIVKTIQIGGEGFKKLTKLAKENPQAFARGIAAFGLPGQEVEAFIISLGLSREFTQRVLLQYKIQLSEYLARIATKSFFEHFDVVIEGAVIKLYKNGEEIGNIINNKLQPKVFLSEGENIGDVVDNFQLVKNGDNFGFKGAFTISNASDVSKIAHLFKTEPNTSFFWSGRTNGIGGEVKALEIASTRGGTTLEGLIKAKGISMPMWDTNNAASVEAWEEVSAEYAKQVFGEVRAVVGKELRVNNVWENIELPRLKLNPNVTKITIIDPETLVETVIYTK